jgi:hypothetical protein
LGFTFVKKINIFPANSSDPREAAEIFCQGLERNSREFDKQLSVMTIEINIHSENVAADFILRWHRLESRRGQEAPAA